MAVQFRILGEVEAVRAGHPLALGPAKPRSVLVALLLDANKVLTIDEVVTRVWGHDAPEQVRSSLHSYFTRLRSALHGEATILRSNQGYLLRTDPASVDLQRFRDEVSRARRSDHPTETLEHLTTALRLWRGTPFAGLHSPWLNNVRTGLLAERDAVRLEQNNVRLALGQHTELLPELAHQTDRHPLDERLAAQYMLALYRCGRQADALLHFQKIKATLADELGVDPNAALRALYQSILREDDGLLPTGRTAEASSITVPPVPEQHPVPIPRQLPSAPAWFVGRDREQAALSTILTPADSGGTRVAVIAGSGGMGKTWLALHWAHHHADRFPDGQLFINLRGFESATDRVSTAHAMRTLLLAFALEPHTIPDNPQALAGLYRSVLADKRVLVVLDNARDADEAGALIPAGPHCSVIVTSRTRLTSLVTSHNAELLTLDVLGPEDARLLLTSRLGPQRAAEEAAAVEELATACGGLPLALSITVGRAREHPDFPMSALVAELRDAGSALSALEVDAEVSIRAVLATSYAALSPDQAHAFHLLGIVPGPDISLPAASALAGRTYAATRTLVRELERTSLVQQHTPGRFRMHDLVRLYAAEQAADRLSAEATAAALSRLSHFYVHTTVVAGYQTSPTRPRYPISGPPDLCVPLELRNAGEARRWLCVEEFNIHAAHDLAKQFGWHELVWAVPWAMIAFHGTSGRTAETVDMWHAGLAAAETLGDPVKVSIAHRMIARAIVRLGDDEEALRHITLSVQTAEQTGDVVEQILALVCMAEIHWRLQRPDLAAVDGSRAWRLTHGEHDTPAELRCLVANDWAWSLAQNGQYDKARQMATIALDLCVGPEARNHRGSALDTLGYIAQQTGHPEQAVDHLEAAAESCAPSDLFAMADILCTLGEARFELGQRTEAEQSLQRALRLYRDQHRPQEMRRAEAILARLNAQ